MKKFLIYFALIAGIMTTGCKRNFEEINTNPNDPTEVPETNVLLSALTSGLYRVHGDNMNITYAGLWAQHYAKIQYVDEDRYTFRSNAIDAHWNGLYAGALFDLASVINTSGDERPNMKAAAMTLSAYYTSVITDCWGNVPYSEAVKGNGELSPSYDSQMSIYSGIIADLGVAAAMFDADADMLGKGDIMFDCVEIGDEDNIVKWEKLANSLRVRLMVRSGDLAGAAAVLSTGPVMESNEDNAGIHFLADNINSNPLWTNANLDGRDDHAVSASLVGVMSAGGFSTVMDPRLAAYANMNASGEYVGQENGEIEPADFAAISRIGDAFRQDATAPVYIMTYAELKFLEAEVNNDEAAYTAGIEASHEQHGVAADPAYMADAAMHWGMPMAIPVQKWIALFGNGVEAWAEVRRAGNNLNLGGVNIVQEPANSQFPGEGVAQRFPYTTTEASTNGANQDAAVAAQGLPTSQDLFTKMSWVE